MASRVHEPSIQKHQVCSGAQTHVKSLLCALKECSRSGDLLRGMQLHSEALSTGLFRNMYVLTSLINMYAKCGDMTDALKTFHSGQEHDVVAWTALILGYMENGKSETALSVFEELQAAVQNGEVVPDSRVYVVALSACASLLVASKLKQRDGILENFHRWLDKGKQIHSQAVMNNCCDIYVQNTLVNFYVQSGTMSHAREVFDRMAVRDIVSWNTLLQGYVENGESELALELFDHIRTPDARTFVAGLTACTALAVKQRAEQTKLGTSTSISSGVWLAKGREIHNRAMKSGRSNIFVENTAVDMYAKCGDMMTSRAIFDNMSRRDSVTWNALLQGYVENGEYEVAVGVFDTMEAGVRGARGYVSVISACAALGAGAQKDGEANSERLRWLEKGRQLHILAVRSRSCDVFVENMLVHMYAQCGSMSEARAVFDNMAHQRNVVSWNCLLQGYVDNGENWSALEMIPWMDASGVGKNSLTYMSLIMACGNLTALEKGKALHGEGCSRGLEEAAVISNGMVSFYGKCGRMHAAKQVFDSVPERTSVSWTSLMCGYSLQGDTERVFELFGSMREEGVRLNDVAFVCILSACSHAGLTDKGREYFTAMCSEFDVSPTIKHYGCLADLFGRASHLEEAVKVVLSMPLKANAVLWRAVLSASSKWNNVAVGKLAYEELRQYKDQ